MAKIDFFLDKNEEISVVEEDLIKAIKSKDEASHKEKFEPPALDNLEEILYRRFDETLDLLMSEIFDILREDTSLEIHKSNPKGNIQEGHHNFSRRKGNTGDYTYVYNKTPIDHIKDGAKGSKPTETKETPAEEEDNPKVNDIGEKLKEYHFNAALGKKSGKRVKYLAKLQRHQNVKDLEKVAQEYGLHAFELQKFYSFLFVPEIDVDDVQDFDFTNTSDWALTKQGGNLVLFVDGDTSKAISVINKEAIAIGQNYKKTDIMNSNDDKLEAYREHLDVFCDGQPIVVITE